MRLTLCILILSLFFNLTSQTDSLKTFRFSALSVEMQLHVRGQFSNTAMHEDFQRFVKNDDLLNRTTAQKNNTGYGLSTYDFWPGLFSTRAFFDLAPAKGFNRQAFIGISFGRVQQLELSYLNRVYDTTDITYGINNYTVNVDVYQSAYSYEISSAKILVPLGLNFITNKQKTFWFSAGIELCPGITFMNVYTSNYEKTRSQYVLDAFSSYSKINSYSRSFDRDVIESGHTRKMIKGAGFNGYAALPLTMNINLPKKAGFLKKFGVFATLAPGIYFTANKFNGSQAFFFVNTCAGLRYSLKRVKP